MKIEGYQLQKMYEAYSKNSTTAADGKGLTRQQKDTAEKTDRVELSEQASKMSDAQGIAQKVSAPAEDSSSREQRVAELKKLVESGQYSVSSKDVARSILTGLFYDRTV